MLQILTYKQDQYLLLVGLSLFNAIGLNLNTLAFQYEKEASFLQLMAQMSVFYAFATDVAVFKEKINNWQLIGGGIILAFNLVSVASKLQSSKTAK